MTSSQSVSLLLEPGLLVLPAGVQSGSLTLRIANRSSVVEQYSVEVRDLDPAWVKVNAEDTHAYPGEECQARIDILVPLQAQAGTYPFSTLVTPSSSPEEFAAVTGTLTIQGVAAMRVWVLPQRRRANRGSFLVEIRNLGTESLSVRLSASDTERRCRISYSERELGIPVGETSFARTIVRADRSNWFGDPYLYHVKFWLEYGSGPVIREEYNVEFEHRPYFRSIWPLLLLFLLCLFLAVLTPFVLERWVI